MILTVPALEPEGREWPSLGGLVCQWIEEHLVFGPGDLLGQPARLDEEKRFLIWRAYEVFPPGHEQAGRRRFKRVSLSLRKGSAKTEFMAWLVAAELGDAPVRCDGFRKDGSPIGRPVTNPYIPMCAYTEEQTEELAYGALREILMRSKLADRFDIGLDRIIRIGKQGSADGKAVAVASSPSARDGARTTLNAFDEALALDTPLPTPTGWTTMGSVRVGDSLVGSDGAPCRVIGKSDVHQERPCYRVTFHDGTSIVADEQHLWYVHRRAGCGHCQGCRCPTVQGWQVRRTVDLLDVDFANSGAHSDRRAYTYHVPTAGPMTLPSAELPLDPYLLGVWLGDGDERNAVLCGAGADLQEISESIQSLGYKVTRCAAKGQLASLVYVTTANSRLGRHGDSVVGRLRGLGLLKHKRIPESYLRASRDQRLALLQGLMDSDGHVTHGGHCTFVNTSPELVAGTSELLRTLGYAPTVKWRRDTRKDTYLPVAKVYFQAHAETPPFRLFRKAARLPRHTDAACIQAITAVELVASVPVQCVAVDSSDRLYLAGSGFVPTHNTHRFTTPALIKAHQTMLQNIPKRRASDAWSLETTTAYMPGERSVAEATHNYALAVASAKIQDSRLFFYHRQASDGHNLDDEKDRRAAVLEASGPVAVWSSVDEIVDQYNDPTVDRTYWERVWLNRPVRSADLAFSGDVWAGLAVPKYRPPAGAQIALGFCGSREDATALVGTEIDSGTQFVVRMWEEAPSAERWLISREEVTEAVESAFTTWDVWKMYADAVNWESTVATWAGKFGIKRVVLFASNNRNKLAASVRAFRNAMGDGSLKHDGDPELTRHIGNSHKRPLLQRDDTGAPLYVLQKARPDSPHRINGAIAAVLSWQARTDAIASGLQPPPPQQSYEVAWV